MTASATTSPHDGGSFRLPLAEGWRDQTLHVLAGPLEDGVQHTLTVAADRELPPMALAEYVDLQLAALEGELKAYVLLVRESAWLADGTPATRAVFSWHPAEDRHVVQEQLYVLSGGTGYRLTATFSKKTYQTLGPEVRAMLLSFTPAT